MDREQRLAYGATYRATHKKERRAYNALHCDEQRAYGRAHYAAHCDEMCAKNAAYAATHKGEKRARDAARQASHGDEQRARSRAYQAANREKIRASRLMRFYGLSPLEYDALLASQGGVCEICGSADPGRGGDNFLVDHDHKTGKVRGLLCAKCNAGLGHFRDDLSLLASAAAYLSAASQAPNDLEASSRAAEPMDRPEVGR